MTEFQDMGKIPRLFRDCIVTEKIDGTNGQIFIGEDGEFFVGSRNRYLTPEQDNFGFARWAYENKDELMKLGPGRHFGEWWGSGIQRGYGLTKGEKRFSLFNVSRWADPQDRPECCDCVPVLYEGPLNTVDIHLRVAELATHGSVAAPGFAKPEGVIVYHTAARQYFKVTCENDATPKSQV
jgi:hypothetical protein